MIEKPTQEADQLAENRIKWGTIIQSLILASIIGSGSIAYTFGGHLFNESTDFKHGVIEGIDGINATLKDIRKDIGELNTGIKVNESRIMNNERRISILEVNK